MQTITRTIPITTINCVKTEVKDGNIVNTPLEPFKIYGENIAAEKADKYIRKNFESTKGVVCVGTTVEEKTYSMSLADFIEKGSIIEPAPTEQQAAAEQKPAKQQGENKETKKADSAK
jgi:hypothetical protein